MSYRDDLIAARRRYAAQLAAQQTPPDSRWSEYERFLLEQIERLDRLLASAEAEEAGEEVEVISGGFTA